MAWADTVARDGADLLLAGDGIRLRFSPVPPVPDRDLAGTRWVPDTLADGDCPADLERQDALVTAVLGAGVRAVVAEDRLTLTGTDGRGLVYRAEG
jgi:hypothetical protein